MLALALVPVCAGAEVAEPNRTPAIRRVPRDALGVSFNRPHLVFQPDEPFRAAISLNLLDGRDETNRAVKAQFKWKLFPAAASRPVREGSTTVAALVNPTAPVQVPLELRLPREEGVYNLRLAASGLGFPDVERVVQLVVVAPHRSSGSSKSLGQEKLVDSFEPASAGLFRKIPGNKLPMYPPQARQTHSLPRFLKFIRPRDESEDESAGRLELTSQAYKLHVEQIGHPHRLELSFPPGSEQCVSLSVMQEDAAGQFVSAGPECQFSIAPPVLGAGSQTADFAGDASVHKQIFWPQNRELVLAMTSRRLGQSIDVTHVKLYDLGEELHAGTRADTWADPPAAGQPALRKRLVGEYLHKPLLAANFGAPQHFDPIERLNIDDWQTFLTAGRRLTESLHYQQQSALLLAVFADGATIYPSRLIEPSVQHDNGRLASNGQDPVQKDVLELLLRLFDRASLALVPELQFDAPLPELERLLHENSKSPGDLQLVNGQGRPRRTAKDVSAGVSPGYNVLSPRVQQAVLDVTRELVERYKMHPSLVGVAFELSPDSFVQLPGIEWGYDRDTIRRFERTTGTRVPHAAGKDGPQEAYQFLTTTARPEWVRFRCAEVARFHRKLAEVVAHAKPDARTIFSGHLGTLGDSDSEAKIVEIVRSGGNPAQSLRGQGLDFTQPAYTGDAKLTVLRPIVQYDFPEALGQAALATLNNSPVIDALYRDSGRGGLLYSISRGNSDLFAETGHALTPSPRGLGSSPSRHESAARRYAHLMATLDAPVIFDGGESVALPSDEATMRLRRTIGRLPDMPFRFAGPQVQPVVVRAAYTGNTTYLQAVNDSALTLKAELVLDCPPATTCRSLENGKHLTFEAGPENKKARLPIEVRGHSLFACRIDRAAVEVLETRLAFSEELLADVHQQIDSLSVRMNAMTNLARAGSRSLSNPGFEQVGSEAGVLPGWELSARNAGWSLDEDNPRSGHKSLQISAEDQLPDLESPDLFLEGSRFVTISVWMRSNKSAARVRMVFDAKCDNEAFQRAAVVEAGKSWKRHFFKIDDLPPGPLHSARLHLRPVDGCKLWIDDIEIDSQSLRSDEVRQLTKTLSSVKLAFEEGRYADCQRLLDGYWGQLLLSGVVAPPVDSPARPRLGERMRNIFRR